MSLVITEKNGESIEEGFRLFLDELTDKVRTKDPKFDVTRTKLGDVKKNLNKLDTLGFKDWLHTVELANKFASIRPVLEIAEVDIGELLKAVKGGFNPDEDSDQKYNDFFFELAMASRYLQIFPKDWSISIKLDGITDIVIDSSLAIECKYLHSRKKVEKNIKKAAKQIDDRVKNGEAKYGIIALDFTHLFDYNKYDERINILLRKYYNAYRENDCVSLDSTIYSKVTHNSIFIEQANKTGLELVEEILQPCLEKLKLSKNIIGIHYEYSNTFNIDCDRLIMLPTRGLSYFPNPMLDDEGKELFKKLSHSLAVGI